MSFLIFSKAGSRSSTVLKMVATPSPIQEKPGLLGDWAPARSGLYHIGHCRPRLTSRPAHRSAFQGPPAGPTFLRSTAKTLAEKLRRSTIWLLPTFIIRSRNASLLILWNIAMKMGPSSPRWISWPTAFGISYATLAASSSRWSKGLVKRRRESLYDFRCKRMNDLSIKHAEVNRQKTLISGSLLLSWKVEESRE